MEEIWIHINNFINYEISNFGRVRSWRHSKGLRKTPYYFYNYGNDNNGYLYVSLYNKENKRKSLKIHRLIAEHFIENKDNKPEVNHKDGNKQNNVIVNLEWVTKSENTIHAFRLGLRKIIKGEDHVNSKYTAEQIIKVKKLYKLNIYSLSEIAKLCDISDFRYVHKIISNKVWSHIKIKN